MTTSIRHPAAARLEDLARCQRIRPYRAGDELLCANDLIGLVATRAGWVHDPAEIARLRASLKDEWPSQ